MADDVRAPRLLLPRPDAAAVRLLRRNRHPGRPAGRGHGGAVRRDGARQPRLPCGRRRGQGHLALAFDEIAHWGKDSPRIQRRVQIVLLSSTTSAPARARSRSESSRTQPGQSTGQPCSGPLLDTSGHRRLHRWTRSHPPTPGLRQVGVSPRSTRSHERGDGCSPAHCGGGQGRGRTADLPIFSRTLVPTELPGRTGDGSGRTNRPLHLGATPTGLEPATSAVTGRRANQLRYGASLKALPNVSPTGFEPVLPP